MSLNRCPPALRRVCGLLCLALVLASCGGGVDSGGTGSFASGPITGFGSIIVGGVHYDESMAAVSDDSGPRSRDALKLGMVTEIDASAVTDATAVSTATAISVRIRSELLGPVAAPIDPVAGTFSVLGQAVQVGATTVFDESFVGGLAGLQAGDVVEVYGQFDAQTNQYTATRIDRPAAAPTAYQLRGPVTTLNTAAHTLVIGGELIQYGGLDPLPNITPGQTLRVRLQIPKAGDHWVAVAIGDGAVPLPDRHAVHLEGRITQFSSLDAFEVDGTPVRTTPASVLPANAATVLVLGAHVEVRGGSAQGILVATRVAIEDDTHGGAGAFEISGAISLLDTGAKTFVLHSVTVSYAGVTRYSGGTEADLRNGRRVEIKGVLSSDRTTVAASSISFDD